MFNRIKQDSLAARKAKSPTSGLLVTLLSEIQTRAKNDGNREPNDDDVVKTIQKFLKGVVETNKILIEQQRDNTNVLLEIKTLESYLPTLMTQEETIAAVKMASEGCDMSDMGKVMGMLKAKHGSKIDMGLASKLFRNNFL